MNLIAEQKYQILFELFQAVRDTFELDEIMAHLLDTILTVVVYDAAGIFVLNQEIIHGRQAPPTNMIAGMCWRGYDPQPTSDDMLTLGKGIIGHVISSGSSLIIPDVRLDQHYIEGRKGTRSEIAVPILRNERAIGSLNLESDQLNAYDESDLEVLQFFADAAAIALEKAMLHRQLLEKELLDKQLQMARDVQMRLLPMENPTLPGYDIAGVCIPAEEIGGDYYDFIPLNHGNLGVAIADVSGHGIASALAMTAFRGLLRTHIGDSLDPAGIAGDINHMIPEITGRSHFITMLYGILDPEINQGTFVSCGHPSPCLLHADGISEYLESNGPAFGIYSNINYVNERMHLLNGDILIMYTDGVLEMENPDGKVYGVENLVNLITKNRALPAKDLIQQVIAQTQAYSGFQTYLDDFTLVIVKKV